MHRHDRDLPETVSKHNIERLREAVYNGPATTPAWCGRRSIDLRPPEKRVRIELQEGDVVDRHL
jgi:hypothetical protein